MKENKKIVVSCKIAVAADGYPGASKKLTHALNRGAELRGVENKFDILDHWYTNKCFIFLVRMNLDILYDLCKHVTKLEESIASHPGVVFLEHMNLDNCVVVIDDTPAWYSPLASIE